MWTAEDELSLQQASEQLDAALNAVATLDARRKAELLTPLGELLICVPSNAGLTGAALHGIKHAEAIVRLLSPLLQPQASMPSQEQFCFCNHDISLQSVSGGAHHNSLYGSVWLRVGDQQVEYMRVAGRSSPVLKGGAGVGRTAAAGSMDGVEA